jgi:hypothetical protein
MYLGSRLDEFRVHVNSHLAESKFDISVGWLSATFSRWCPCGNWIISLSLLCSHCRGSQSEIVRRRPPKADGLPPPPGLKPDISIRISGPEVQPLSHDVKEAVFKDVVGFSGQSEALLDLCRIDVPLLLKYLPGPAASPFARAWASLFLEAYSKGTVECWRAVFMFPKAVLLAPLRMGKKVSNRQGSLATQVLDRLRRWSSDRAELWAEVLARAAHRKNGLQASGLSEKFS